MAVIEVTGEGIVSSASVMSPDTMFVHAGGRIIDTEVSAQGIIEVGNSGYGENITVSNGGVLYVQSEGVVESGSIRQGGLAEVTESGSLNDMEIDNGGSMHVCTGGIASAFNAKKGAVVLVESNGIVRDMAIWGVMSMENGGKFERGVVNSGGLVKIRTSSYADSIVIESRGSANVGSGGSAVHAIIHKGGVMTFSGTGYGQDVAIDGKGSAVISSGGSVSEISATGNGTVIVHSGGSLENATIDDESILTVSRGGVASYVNVTNYGKLNVMSGGAVKDIRVTSSAGVTVSAGATVSNVTVETDAYGLALDLWGKASNVELESGGWMKLNSGAVLDGLTVKTGGILLGSLDNCGGTIDGLTVESGAMLAMKDTFLEGTMDFQEGVTCALENVSLDFSVNDMVMNEETQITDDILVKNLDALYENGSPAAYSITVKDEQDSGIYRLATQASLFETEPITIKTTSETLGLVMAGGDLLAVAEGDSFVNYAVVKTADNALNLYVIRGDLSQPPELTLTLNDTTMELEASTTAGIFDMSADGGATWTPAVSSMYITANCDYLFRAMYYPTQDDSKKTTKELSVNTFVGDLSKGDLWTEISSAVQDERLATGAKLQLRGGTFAVSTEDMSRAISFNGVAARPGEADSEVKTSTLSVQGDFAMNGHAISMNEVTMAFSGASDKLYGGKLYSDMMVQDGITDESVMTLSNVDVSGHQIFGGGKLDAATQMGFVSESINMTLSGDTSASRVYGGFDMNLGGSGISMAQLTGNVNVQIDGGIYGMVRGGVAKTANANGAVEAIFGNAETIINGGVINGGVCGDYQVGQNVNFSRTGNVAITVNDGVINGSLIGGGLLFGGTYVVGTDSTPSAFSIDIHGGTIAGNIYGGASVGDINPGVSSATEQNANSAIALSKGITIKGTTSITIDCSENMVTIGKAPAEENSRVVTSIYTGCFGEGTVTGNTSLLLTGDGSNLTLRGDVVEFIGDSSWGRSASSEQGLEKWRGVGSSTLTFQAFTGDISVNNIAGFSKIVFDNSEVHFTSLTLARQISETSTWSFLNLTDGKTVMDVDSTNIANSFKNDTINLTFDAESMNECTLIDADSKYWLQDLESAVVSFNGETLSAAQKVDGCWSDGTFKLYVDAVNHDLKLARITAAI